MQLPWADVLVPRRDVVALPADASAEEGIQKLVETGHSRAPVYRNDLDDVVGIVHLRDLVGVDAGWPTMPVRRWPCQSRWGAGRAAAAAGRA
jgi:CBS domain containing-hemolysin-like protein